MALRGSTVTSSFRGREAEPGTQASLHGQSSLSEFAANAASGVTSMPSSYTLGPHFEGFVRELVESGRYASASEVIRDSLRLLEEREKLQHAKLEALRAAIAEGLESAPAEPLDIAFIKAAARRERGKHRAA